MECGTIPYKYLLKDRYMVISVSADRNLYPLYYSHGGIQGTYLDQFPLDFGIFGNHEQVVYPWI